MSECIIAIFLDITLIATILGGMAAAHYYCDKNKYSSWTRWFITLIGIIATICYLGSRYTYPKEFIMLVVIIFTAIPILYGLRRKMMSCEILKTPELETPEGQVHPDSKFYVERPPIESECYEEIVKPAALIRVKAPRQMGKSSLMTRILKHAEKNGCHTANLSFQDADASVFEDLNKFLQWFCTAVARESKLSENRAAECWEDGLGGKDNCFDFFKSSLLKNTDKPLVLGLDEVDRIFEHKNVAHDFFGLLRAWHEKGKHDEMWKRLRLVIVHSREVYVPLKIHESPFNVGLAKELPELNPEQIRDLAERHGLVWNETELQDMIKMLGGHPYLLRKGMYELVKKHITFDNLLKFAPTEQGIYADHLRRHLLNLRKDSDLTKAMKQAVRSTAPVQIDAIQGFQLNSMGLVKYQGNDVVPLCDLYRKYFQARL